MDMSLSKLRELLMDREAWRVAVHGVAESDMTEWLNWTELWCWRRLLRVPWTARSNQSILKETSPEYSLEGLMLKLKLQYFGHLMRRVDIGKDPDAEKDWRQEEKGTTEDEMVGWCHWLDGHEFEQASGVGDGQGGLACCSPWGRKELDTNDWVTELNWTETHIHTVTHTYPTPGELNGLKMDPSLVCYLMIVFAFSWWIQTINTVVL